VGRETQLLLDTHALFWWWLEDPKLSPAAAEAIVEADTVCVSPVAAMELAIKHRLGKLRDGDKVVPRFRGLALKDRFRVTSVTLVHALHAGSYAVAHRDPFDRLLAAQAELEDLTLVTRDPAFAEFPCVTLW
jgi:PIN domain nuclease of toxin-antitoxin system